MAAGANKSQLRLVADEKSQDPEELLAAIQAGGRSGAATLYDRFGPDMDRLVWRLLGADSEHQDVVHDALCEVLRQVWRVREADSLRRWVHTVTACVVRKELRSRSYRRRFFGFEADPDRFEAAGADADTRRLLARTFTVLARMPVDERLAFSLRFVERFSTEEMAAALDCSERTVRRKLGRAKKRFRRLARRDPQLSALLSSEEQGGADP